jgi:hypothetical protein
MEYLVERNSLDISAERDIMGDSVFGQAVDVQPLCGPCDAWGNIMVPW